MTDFRSPICSIIGHVDSGKTLALDFLRGSNVQFNEFGAITQKIGVTFMTKERLVHLTESINKNIEIPGIMWIDTPGHAPFSSQRITGIEISDIVIIMLDIFKGLEPQTMECLELLKESKTPFIVAVNKMDRISEWETGTASSLKEIFSTQKKHILKRLDDYMKDIVTQFAINGLNALPYYKNNNAKEFISLVPISAKTGEGIPDLLMLINTLVIKFLKKKLIIKQDFISGFFLEKIKNDKYGDVSTVIITDGQIKHNTNVLTISENGEIQENKIRNAYKTNNNQEIKDKFNLKMVESIEGGQSGVLKMENINIKVGTRFYVFNDDKEKEIMMGNMSKKKKKLEDKLNKQFVSPGIYINAQTCGMASALYRLCEQNKIPVSGMNIGNISKIHLMKTAAILTTLDKNDKDDEIFYKRYCTILAYGIEDNKVISQLAEKDKVKILHSNIVYELLEKYNKYCSELDNLIKQKHPNIFPKCEVQIMEQYIFIKKNPLLFGVKVLKNKIIKGMLLQTNNLVLGRVVSIQKNKKSLDEADSNEEVCIKIDPETYPKYEYGKDFDSKNLLINYYTTEDNRIISKFGKIFCTN